MSSRPTALLDVNVILDVMQRRQPWFHDAAAVMAAAETGRLTGMVAGHAVTTVFYLLAKYGSRDAARMRVAELLRVLKVAPVDGEVAAYALALPYGDFEDAVLMAAADRAGAHYVVTRDRTLFAAGPVPAVTPGEMLALLSRRSAAGR
ncbi:MAG TPA: PIN domain-containing protein [Thermoleophilia bacterium]|nr:PIN domain-containing protein [Thermoleophilia bacterium]HQG04264.1 PIN domain-containing protein [Thermoleophilia bacterium]HQG55307.1 PIN domain-containing protein [Thermoleophilia bacterium]HQJ98272.1 PIN domain-containing protein [Thermoleophilia bacterium]